MPTALRKLTCSGFDAHLLAHFDYPLLHFNRSRTRFSVFRKQRLSEKCHVPMQISINLELKAIEPEKLG